ncbi:RRM domain-containing protein [Entamoeba marina]
MSAQYDYNTLYIVGVTDRASEDDVREIFGKYGEIDKINMLSIRPPFKTRTVFIRYFNEEESRRALDDLNNTDPFFAGSTLSVRFSEKNHSRKHSPPRSSSYERRDPVDYNYPKQTPPQFQNQPPYYQSQPYYSNPSPYGYQQSSYRPATQNAPQYQQQQQYPQTTYSPYSYNNPYKTAQYNTTSPTKQEQQYTGVSPSNYNTNYPSMYPHN